MKSEIKLAKKFYINELFDEKFYFDLSKSVEGNFKKELEELSKTEKKHVKFWESFLIRRNKEIKKSIFLPIKIFFFKIFVKIFGISFIIGILEVRETSAINNYTEIYNKGKLNEEEKKKLKEIISEEISHEDLIIREKLKFSFNIKRVRDSLYGMMDSLVEILALVAGLASIVKNPLIVALGGLIGAFAGAFAMSAGAYLSSKSQKEIYKADEAKLKAHIFADEKGTVNKVKEYLIKKGVKKEDVEEITKRISKYDHILYHFLKLSEQAFFETETENPRTAARDAGIYYIVGSLFPIMPFILLLHGTIGLIFSIISSVIGISMAGIVVSYVTGISTKRKITEMILVGLLAAAATYTIGTLLKFSLGIPEL